MYDPVRDDDAAFTGIRPLLVAQLGEQLAADRAVLLFVCRSRLRRWLSTFKRSARLTMPTILPSCTTGTRLICFVSSRSAISPSVANSSTLKTSRVMMSATRLACDLMYSAASREFDENGSLQRGRCAFRSGLDAAQQVAFGHHPDEPSVLVHDRNATDAKIDHQPRKLFDGGIRRCGHHCPDHHISRPHPSLLCCDRAKLSAPAATALTWINAIFCARPICRDRCAGGRSCDRPLDHRWFTATSSPRGESTQPSSRSAKTVS